MTEDRVPTQSLDDTLRAWGLDPASFIESLTGWGYEIRRSEQPAPPLDVERLGFNDLLDVADAILRHYPPDTIVCSHLHRADIGARTVAAIADLVASVRLGSAPSRSEPEEVNK